jgi:hypothetical protein
MTHPIHPLCTLLQRSTSCSSFGYIDEMLRRKEFGPGDRAEGVNRTASQYVSIDQEVLKDVPHRRDRSRVTDPRRSDDRVPSDLL